MRPRSLRHLQEFGGGAEDGGVGGYARRDAGPLHLDRDLDAVDLTAVHLREGRRGDSLSGREHRERLGALLADDGPGELNGRGFHLVLEPLELRGELLTHQVRPGRQRLSELDVRRAQFLDRRHQILVLLAVEQRPDRGDRLDNLRGSSRELPGVPPEVGADCARVVSAHLDDVFQLLQTVPLRLLQPLQHLGVDPLLLRRLRVDGILVHQRAHEVQVVLARVRGRAVALLVHEDLRAVLAVGGVRASERLTPVPASRTAIRPDAMRLDDARPSPRTRRVAPSAVAGRCGPRGAKAPPVKAAVAWRVWSPSTGGTVAADPGNQVERTHDRGHRACPLWRRAERAPRPA